MIWLTWRQFRTQAVVAVAGLAAIAIYLGYLGFGIRSGYADLLTCAASDCPVLRHDFEESYGVSLRIAGLLLIAVPALIGIFWGAPLISGELEERTDRLVWNQSVTRTRWLAAKLGLLTLVTAVLAGLYSLLMTWTASRYDQLAGNRFGALDFAARNVVPVGYAAFAFVLGTVIGLIVRRTLPAMALTLAVFAVVQLLVPTVLRAHLMPPVTTTVIFDEQTPSRSELFAVNDRGATIVGYTMPGTWSLTGESTVFNADGTPFTEKQAKACDRDMSSGSLTCMAGLNLHFSYTYQPANRYWPFQWIELGAYLAVTAVLAAVAFLRIRRPS